MIHDDTAEPGRTSPDLFEALTSTPGFRRSRTGRAPNVARDIPFMQRPTCTIREACQAVGMGRTKFYELIKGGELQTISVGRRRLVQGPSLLKFLRIEISTNADGGGLI